MSEIGDAIQEKCLAFGDRIIKLNDYLLEQESKKEDERCRMMYDGRSKMYDVKGGDPEHHTSNIKHQTSRVPIYLKSVATLANQLLRSGTSVGANNAEATSAISKADFKSKSYIALKEARESLYWLNLLHRNKYLDDKQYNSLYTDCDGPTNEARAEAKLA